MCVNKVQQPSWYFQTFLSMPNYEYNINQGQNCEMPNNLRQVVV